MTYIKAHDGLGSGLDMSSFSNGVNFIKTNGVSVRFRGEFRYDHDTWVLQYEDTSSSNLHEFSIFYRFSGTNGVVVESVYYSNKSGQATLDWYNDNIYISQYDLLYGGNDWIFTGFRGNDTIIGNKYADVLKGGGGNDVLFGRGGHDRLYGEAGSDTLHGEAGNDWLYGGAGNDRLYGGPGNDRLFGGSGNDVIVGGTGTDVLSGGTGSDVFVFKTPKEAGSGRNADTITDFDPRYDYIDVSGIDANVHRNGNQAFTFIGKKAFSEKAGELRFKNEGALGDIDGDGRADFKIVVTGWDSLRDLDFIL